jgi:hypothetical protein
MGRLRNFVLAVARAYAEGQAASEADPLREDLQNHLNDDDAHVDPDDYIDLELFDDVVRRLEEVEDKLKDLDYWKADRHHGHAKSGDSITTQTSASKVRRV